MGNTLAWEKGRQLKTFGTNSYKYNNDGIRIKKTTSSEIHDYILDGTNIVKEVVTDICNCPKYTNEYLYDLDGTVCGLKYNGTAYYFYKNLQGDVIAITDDKGDIVARYTYDAWGKCTVVSDNSDVNAATINPFRYRSYYYDAETKLYYLQSRYYNPAVGRFINADDVTTVSCEKNILSNNIFCYVYNSPSNETDENGNIIGTIIKKIIVGILKGLAIRLILDIIEYLCGKYMFNSTDPFKPSPAQDYIESVYDEVLGALVDDFGLAFRTFIGIIQIAMKYLPKITSNKMSKNDWTSLAIDALFLLITTLIEGKKIRSKKQQLNALKRKRKKHEKNTYVNSQIKSLKFKFKKKFVKLEISFEFSGYLLTLVTDLLLK